MLRSMSAILFLGEERETRSYHSLGTSVKLREASTAQKLQRRDRVLTRPRLKIAAAQIALVFATLFASFAAGAEEKSIVVASTTSTQDSGLFGYILPLFKAKTGIDVRVVAQGTGQALDTGP